MVYRKEDLETLLEDNNIKLIIGKTVLSLDIVYDIMGNLIESRKEQ